MATFRPNRKADRLKQTTCVWTRSPRTTPAAATTNGHRPSLSTLSLRAAAPWPAPLTRTRRWSPALSAPSSGRLHCLLHLATTRWSPALSAPSSGRLRCLLHLATTRWSPALSAPSSGHPRCLHHLVTTRWSPALSAPSSDHKVVTHAVCTI